MAARMAGAAVGRRFDRVGAQAAERKSQNENPARRPGARIGSQRFRRAFDRNGPGVHGDVRCPPVSLHREDPLIGYSDGRVCSLPQKKTYTISRLGRWYSDQSARHFSKACLVSSAAVTQRYLFASHCADFCRLFRPGKLSISHGGDYRPAAGQGLARPAGGDRAAEAVRGWRNERAGPPRGAAARAPLPGRIPGSRRQQQASYGPHRSRQPSAAPPAPRGYQPIHPLLREHGP